MKICARPFSSVKASYLIVTAVFTATFLLTVFSNRCSDHFLARQYLQCLPTQTFRANVSLKSPKIMEQCDTRQVTVNLSTCPTCLRPGVQEIGSYLQEIDNKHFLTSDQPPNFFHLRPDVVQNLTRTFLIAPKISCPYLLIIQPTLSDRRSERDTVRRTWASVAKQQIWPNRNVNAEVKVVFAVGIQLQTGSSSSESGHGNSSYFSEQLQNLRDEASQENDILLLDLTDSYRNLTLKILSAFSWVKDFCPCVKFVLKVDYDTFVNVPLLVDTLLYFEKRLSFSIVGMIYASYNWVFREGRWEVDRSVYPMRSYPEYASGSLCVSVCLSVCLSACLSVCLSFCLFAFNNFQLVIEASLARKSLLANENI